MPKRLALATLAAGLLLTSAEVSFAQPPRQGGPQQQDLSTVLHLRPDQMGAYKSWQAAAQPRPEEINQLRAASPQALASVPTPVRLQRIDAALNVQSQMFHRSADATRAFYGQLSPDQKHTFDQVTAAPQGGGRPPSGG